VFEALMAVTAKAAVYQMQHRAVW